eukprot:7360096-Prymnesium_polylepis.1
MTTRAGPMSVNARTRTRAGPTALAPYQHAHTCRGTISGAEAHAVADRTPARVPASQINGSVAPTRAPASLALKRQNQRLLRGSESTCCLRSAHNCSSIVVIRLLSSWFRFCILMNSFHCRTEPRARHTA